MIPHLDWNTIFRDAVLAGLKYVPEVGGLLSSITGVLWPEDKPNPLQEVSDYIDQMMQQLLEQVKEFDKLDKISTLRDLLRTANKANQDYQTDTDPNKGRNGEYYADLLAALEACNGMRTAFVDDNLSTPENTLRFLVPYGTIRLMLLREEYIHYLDIYDANVTPTPDVPPSKLLELQQEIALFQGMVTSARETALKARRACLTMDNSKDEVELHAGLSARYWEVVDKYPSAAYERKYWYELEAYQDHVNRKWDIDVADDGWLSSFNSYLDASRLWGEFDPSKGYKPLTDFKYWQTRYGPNMNMDPKMAWPGDRYGGEDWDYGALFNDAEARNSYGPITSLNLHTDPSKGLTGIEVWYGGVSGGLHGFPSATVTSYTLNVGPTHSYITEVGGAVDSRVSRFWFRTNLDNVANPSPSVVGQRGGGIDVADNFHYSVTSQDSTDENLPRLAYVSGYASAGGIGQLRLCWAEGAADIRNQWDQNKINPRGNDTPVKARPKGDGRETGTGPIEDDLDRAMAHKFDREQHQATRDQHQANREHHNVNDVEPGSIEWKIEHPGG